MLPIEIFKSENRLKISVENIESHEKSSPILSYLFLSHKVNFDEFSMCDVCRDDFQDYSGKSNLA